MLREELDHRRHRAPQSPLLHVRRPDVQRAHGAQEETTRLAVKSPYTFLRKSSRSASFGLADTLAPRGLAWREFICCGSSFRAFRRGRTSP